MPEGDTIFRAATALRKAVEGARVVRFRSERLEARPPLEGQLIALIEARGKNLIVHFEDGRALRTHMKMTGSWHLYRSGEKWQKPGWQARVAIVADNGFEIVCFNAPVVELLSAGQLLAELGSLGPDATTDHFDAAEALQRLRALAETPIGEALLDQRALAGLGNVIKSEVLFIERQDPFRPVSALSDEQLGKLIAEGHRVLVRNRAGGPRVTRESLDGERHWVYGRSGKPCRVCGAPIELRRQGAQGRSTYYCPRCQCGAPPLSTASHSE